LDKPTRPRIVPGGELPLAGASLAGLMRAVLDKGKPFRFEARGTSMHPFIQDGDVVTIEPFAEGGPRTGDVVAFVHPGTGGVRVHRIVKAEGGRYLLKGDNALGDDGAFGRDALLGLVAGQERRGRARRLEPAFISPIMAALSRSPWFTRLSRRVRRAFGRGDGRT
jgi:hypothetical protein